MAKYYCDYCDIYLTCGSSSMRKTHCYGRKHRDNVRLYYQKWLEEQAQQLIDATTAAFKAREIAITGIMDVPPPRVLPIGPYGISLRPLPPYPGPLIDHLGVTPCMDPMKMGHYGPMLPIIRMQPETPERGPILPMGIASPIELMRPSMMAGPE